MYPNEFYVNFNIGNQDKKRGTNVPPLEFENVILFFFPLENNRLNSQTCFAQVVDNALFAR